MLRAVSTPRDDVPAPSSDDRAPDIVSIMDIPVTSPIPLLRLKTLACLRRTAAERRRSKKTKELEDRLSYGKDEIKRLQKLKRRRSSKGLPVSTSFTNPMHNLPKLQEMDEDFHVSKNLRNPCECRSCKHLKRWSSTLQPYRCTDNSCKIAFELFTDMYEHQLEVHGGLDPRSNRVVNDTFRQQRGTLAYPPPTVYAAQQFMVPSRPPTPWKSMKELDEEAKIVRKKLVDYNQQFYETPFKLFDMGYKLVKKNGWKEVQWQYQIAMEHFYSGLKFPASSRGFRDGCPSVERGRNWLTSTDRKDARVLYPFSLGDKIDVEPEFVLIDTKRDREMQENFIEISDDSGDEDLSTTGGTGTNEKIFKTDDDVEMKAPEDDDNRIELKASGGDEGKTTSESKAFDFDSDSDVTVKSETESENELKTSRTADASDSDSDGEGELEPKDSRYGVDETASDSDSSSDDEIDLRASKVDNDSLVSDSSSDDEVELKAYTHTVTGSDSESNSDSDNDEDPVSSKTKSVLEVFSSSEDSSNDSNVETKLPKDESSQFVSDTESESGEEHRALNSQDDIFNQLE
ncbi:hypothetical protein PC121_g2838 [Phytophthora cactorum]|nr:hypothetical protein PC120_g1543 [Phytophthora cactorum]KAG3095364.1 hypothetical protein PC121_g2838 [Phytophthora cactorum]KAG4063391.1 hypothetical protein PC123_g1746 [Phytophthora cactorum]